MVEKTGLVKSYGGNLMGKSWGGKARRKNYLVAKISWEKVSSGEKGSR